jgi:hypothetical protein
MDGVAGVRRIVRSDRLLVDYGHDPDRVADCERHREGDRMSHRTFNFAYGTVEVFDTVFAARRYIRATPGDLMVLARGKQFFKRKDGMELHIILTATRCNENALVLDAAHQIAHHIEDEIAKLADDQDESA